jgi:branched-chain amino acid transport system ATP-binding protein
VELLDMVGLASQARALASTLSIGNQKRLELARALATGPELLLCDEMCGGLTNAETQTMLSLLGKIRDEGTTIVYIEHDMKAVMSVCERIAVLNFGEKLAEGTPDEIRCNPAVVEAYLGKAFGKGETGE